MILRAHIMELKHALLITIYLVSISCVLLTQRSLKRRKVLKMQFSFIFTVFNFLIFYSNCEITKFLREYIESKNRLQKYTATTFVDYEKNQSSFLEENLFLNLKGYVPISESNNLKNKTLNIAVFQLDNHEFDCKILRNNLNETIITGYSIDLIKSLQDILHFNVQYTIIDLLQNGNESLEQKLLNNNQSDLIICHPDINTYLTEILFPTLESSYVLIYKPTNLSFTEDIFILTFAGTLWLCFIIILILLAVSLRISTQQYNRIYGHPKWDSVEITFWAIATACQQGLSSIPYGFASRLIIFLGAITAYLLYTGFAAGITSLVAVQNQNFEITITDIEKMKLNVVSFGNLVSLPTKYNYLRNSWETTDMKTFFKQLDEKHWIGITLEIFLNEYFTKNTQIKETCTYMIQIIKESKHVMSNLVPKNSQLRKIFNYWYTRLRSYGIHVSSPLFDASSWCHGDDAAAGYSSARLQHVRSAILVLLVGLGVSVVFAIGECIWNGYVHRKSRRGGLLQR